MSTEIKLRPYQELCVSETRKHFAEGKRRILIVLPTGGGKTTVASYMIKNAIHRNITSLFVAHRKELITQASNRLKAFSLNPGIIMGKLHYKGGILNVGSIQTLSRRELPPAKFIFIDEAHHVASAQFERFIANYPDAFIVGLTATPYRMDGKPLGFAFQEIVNPVTTLELIEQGSLLDPIYIIPKSDLDLSSVHTSKGEYNDKELFSAFDKPKIYSNLFETWTKFGKDLRTIIFCVNVAHANNTLSLYIGQGISAGLVTGEMNAKERDSIFSSFASGIIQVLINVNIATEGYDLPAIECVILNRATLSMCLYKQMVGRGARPYLSQRNFYVIDMGGNVERFGLWETDPEFSLTAKVKKRKEGIAPIKNCPQCDAIISIQSRICKFCNYEYPLESKNDVPLETEFQILDKKKMREKLPLALRYKRWGEMSEDELKTYQRIMNYKPSWVQVQLKLQRGGI